MQTKSFKYRFNGDTFFMKWKLFQKLHMPANVQTVPKLWNGKWAIQKLSSVYLSSALYLIAVRYFLEYSNMSKMMFFSEKINYMHYLLRFK